jgi:serine/threonine protein kinase
MAFAVGQRIGDYEIVGQLGAGGLGVVYEVQHLISRRREAMKILLPDQSGAAEMVERFRREVQTLAGLNHGNIAVLHTAFYHEDQLAMVMELVRGETLRERILRAAITLPQVLDIAGQVLQALDYAHRLGVVHRDIKPSNMMITESGLVKLLDFGIARTEKSSDLTKSGFMVGSLNYMSPEQVSGQKAAASSDIYSVGVTVYELLTGRLPIAGATSYETMLGIMQQVPVPPHEIAPAVPMAVSAAVMRSLEKDPMRRFATAAEFLAALQGTSEGHPAARERATGLAPAKASPTPVPQTPSHPSTGMVRPTPQSGSGMQSLPLEEVTRKLAVYIGPVAKFVVKKLAAQSDDIDSIYREAAKQITSETDRAAFLRSKAH